MGSVTSTNLTAPSQSLAVRDPSPSLGQSRPPPPMVSGPVPGGRGSPLPPCGEGLTPPSTGTFSETVIFSPAPGQAPSQEVDACASTAFSGIMGHTNAISDECSSNGQAGSLSSPDQSDGAGPPRGKGPLSSALGAPLPPHRSRQALIPGVCEPSPSPPSPSTVRSRD